MRAPRVVYALILALFGLLLSACQNEHRPALRIATNPWPGYEFLHLAQMLGYYEEYGVQVKLLELASLNDARVSFERGQADGFTGTLIEVLMARQFSSRQPRIVLVTDYSNGGDLLIAKASIADLDGLREKRVGVEPGTLNLYLLQRALETQGMKLSDVQLVGMNQEAMAPAMAADELDAAVTYPPSRSACSKAPATTPCSPAGKFPKKCSMYWCSTRARLSSAPTTFVRYSTPTLKRRILPGVNPIRRIR